MKPQLGFGDPLAQFGVSKKKKVMLNVSTRLNSTYMMLKAGKYVELGFIHYTDIDSNYRWWPNDEEWEMYGYIEGLLEKNYQTIELLSISKSTTSNIFFACSIKDQNALCKELPPHKTNM